MQISIPYDASWRPSSRKSWSHPCHSSQIRWRRNFWRSARSTSSDSCKQLDEARSSNHQSVWTTSLRLRTINNSPRPTRSSRKQNMASLLSSLLLRKVMLEWTWTRTPWYSAHVWLISRTATRCYIKRSSRRRNRSKKRVRTWPRQCTHWASILRS